MKIRQDLAYTTAGQYNLKKEKEDIRGNGKFDLNTGYDTKGKNVRGGIGFRVIY